MKIFQKGFNYSQDGPGNRLVYHMSGCNLSCKWCSNPEGMSLSSGKYTKVSADDILKEALSCTPMFFSGGGVTFTGGEPTCQFEELKKTLILLKEHGINTALETNATHSKLTSLLPYIDTLMMDFKHYDSDTHKKWTGLENEAVKKNFKEIAVTNRKFIVRIPVINGFNNSPDGFIDFFKEHGNHNISYEILPYHEYGKEKWTLPYEVTNGFISNNDLKSFEDAFTNNNMNLIHM